MKHLISTTLRVTTFQRKFFDPQHCVFLAKKSEHHGEDFLSQFLSFGNSREKKKWNLLVKRRRPLFGFGKKLLFPKKEANYDAGRGIYVETETVT